MIDSLSTNIVVTVSDSRKSTLFIILLIIKDIESSISTKDLVL